MKRKIPKSEFGEITQAVSLFPDGVSFEKLLEVLTLDLPRRTIQHRLSSLVKKGVLMSQGKTKALQNHSACSLDVSSV